MSKDSDERETPNYLYRQIIAKYGNCYIDVAATLENKKCEAYFDIAKDGLKEKWGQSNWCNPPYSNPMPWVRKAFEETLTGMKTVMLLKADTSTKVFKFCWDNADEISFITPRVRFVGFDSSADFASMLVIFKPNYRRQALITLFEYKRE